MKHIFKVLMTGLLLSNIVMNTSLVQAKEKDDISNVSSKINYKDFTSFKELSETVGEEELQNWMLSTNKTKRNYLLEKQYIQVLERLGTENAPETMREDVYDFITKQELSDNQKEPLIALAKTMHSIFALTPNEIRNPKNLVILNAGVLGSAFLIPATAVNQEEEIKTWDAFFKTKDLILNDENRKDYFNFFISTSTPIFESKELTEFVVKQAYALAFNSEPTDQEVKDLTAFVLKQKLKGF